MRRLLPAAAITIVAAWLDPSAVHAVIIHSGETDIFRYSGSGVAGCWRGSFVGGIPRYRRALGDRRTYPIASLATDRL